MFSRKLREHRLSGRPELISNLFAGPLTLKEAVIDSSMAGPG